MRNIIFLFKKGEDFMLKEKVKKSMEYVKTHKAEIVIGVATTGALIYLGYSYKDVCSKFVKVKSVAKNSLERELSRINFEIDELKDSIDRLDANVNINKYCRIPERNARIEELIIQKTEVYKELEKIK